jgi:23S rRNA (uracil1939-C5)-methyltransferase
VRVDALANGGEGVGRLPDGRAVFVAGALPGESVSIELVEDRPRWARARLVAVLEASTDRVEPPCAWQRAGCGGCDLMHLRAGAQVAAKVRLAGEALERLGRLPGAVVEAGPVLPSFGVRTTVRLAVQRGRAAFRRRSSHDLLDVDSCRVAHPLLADLLAEGRFGDATEATLRVGVATGERLVVLDGTGRGAVLPDDVQVVTTTALRRRSGDTPAVHEDVAGRRWRISAGSFFQAGPVGAAALVDTVRAAAAPPPGGTTPAVALDAYSGVGLLAAALPEATSVVAVESNPSSVADARINHVGRPVELVEARFERWRPRPVDLAVADPARRGLGRAAAEVLAATAAPVIVLVSCDLAALGRDSADLVALGYDHVRSTVLDLFPHTSHAEVVTRFVRR